MRLDGVYVQQIVLALVVYFFDDDADDGCDEDAGHMMPYRRHQSGMQHPTRKNTSSNVHARTQNALVGETPCELTVQIKVIRRPRYYEIQNGESNVRLYSSRMS